MSEGKSCVVDASGWLPLSTRELRVAMLPTVGHPPWTRFIMVPKEGSVLNRCCPVKYLHTVDLDSFAICSLKCRALCNSNSLDQRRAGTIVCSQHSSVLRVLRALSSGDWNNELYSSNWTYLVIKQVENLTTV